MEDVRACVVDAVYNNSGAFGSAPCHSCVKNYWREYHGNHSYGHFYVPPDSRMSFRRCRSSRNRSSGHYKVGGKASVTSFPSHLRYVDTTCFSPTKCRDQCRPCFPQAMNWMNGSVMMQPGNHASTSTRQPPDFGSSSVSGNMGMTYGCRSKTWHRWRHH